MRIARGFGAAALIGMSVGACNQVFGIEEATRIGADAGDEPDSQASDGDGTPEVVGLGPPYALSRAGTGLFGENIDISSSTITARTLTAWTRSGASRESPQVGTSSVVDFGGDPSSPVIWGRWSGGTTASPPVFVLPSAGGIHYALGDPSPDPSGILSKLDYRLIASTQATSGDGLVAPGTISGTASILKAIGTTTGSLDTGYRVGLSLTVRSDVSYIVATAGGSEDPLASVVGFARTSAISSQAVLAVPRAGRACLDDALPCHADVHGFIAGSDYERLALVIEIASIADDKHRVTVVAIFAKK